MANPNVFEQLVLPRSVMDYSADLDRQEAQRLTLQGQRRQNALQDLAARQQVQRQNALQRVAAGWTPEMTLEQRADTLRTDPSTFGDADALEKIAQERAKTKAETNAKDVDTENKVIGVYRDMIGMAQTPQAAADMIRVMHSDPRLVNTAIARVPLVQGLAQIGADPESFARWKQQFGLGATKFIEQNKPQYISQNTGGASVIKAVPGLGGPATQVSSVQNTQSPDNAATNARLAADAAASRAQAQQHFEASQNQPQYMQTESGLVALPKKMKPSEEPKATVITGPNGESLGKPMKDIPANVNTAIITNAQNLARVDQALKLLGGQDIGELKGDKTATGVKGYLPQGLLNRADSRGIDTRAMIADLGSMVIHDRSGAAVTAAESPRLMPFIPLITDSADTATKKLKRFKQVYEQEQQALNDTYSKAQGYKPNPVASGGGTPTRTSSGATTSHW
ncbi:MAG TPA: hypothetical protein VIN03_13820 [Roseateles sp.]